MSRQLPLLARVRRPRHVAVLAAVVVTALGTAAGWSGATASASATTTPVDLSGVTINVADQLKEYETAFAATGDPFESDPLCAYQPAEEAELATV